MDRADINVRRPLPDIDNILILKRQFDTASQNFRSSTAVKTCSLQLHDAIRILCTDNQKQVIRICVFSEGTFKLMFYCLRNSK